MDRSSLAQPLFSPGRLQQEDSSVDNFARASTPSASVCAEFALWTGKIEASSVSLSQLYN